MLRCGLGMTQGSQICALERPKEEEGRAEPDTIQNPGGWSGAGGRQWGGKESVNLKNTSELSLMSGLCWGRRGGWVSCLYEV